jgi:parallel beta-helix repeat protein
VRDGIYTENVEVNNSHLTVQSENGSDSTIVQVANPDDHVFEVTADYVNISGFTVEGATDHRTAGIYLYYADYSNISNNNCSNNYEGISLYGSNHNIISNNNCSLNYYNGICLWFSCNNSISNNRCSISHRGIFLGYSNNNSVSNNRCSNNAGGIELSRSNNNKLTGNTMLEEGIEIWGDSLSHYSHEIDESNTVNRKPVYYWKDVNGGRIPDGAGQVILVNCKDVVVENQDLNKGGIGIEVAFSSYIIIKNNNCSNNDDGIVLWYSNNNSITSNNCSNNWYGICLRYSNDNIIKNNNCSSNNYFSIDLWYSNNNSIKNNNCSNNWYVFYNRVGIYISNSNNNSISNNNCSNNYAGLALYESNNNKIHLNNFINNTDNVHSSDSTNIWNSTEEITYTYNDSTYTNYLGNYWGDYKEKYPDAEEIDGCGIWDMPYSIDSDRDYHPLMEPWENYFKPPEEEIFDTGSPANPYPSIMGNHTGTIKPNHTVTATKLYTYPCVGTGGHTEYARISNKTWNATATWEGYAGDWHNISFDKTVVLLAGETYNYTIHTGSYPQIIHESAFNATGGTITCDKFIDANGKIYYDWIPAIKLWT